MTEQEHDEWVRQATGEAMVTKSASNDAWARYFAGERKRIDKQLAELAYSIGQAFGVEKRQLRAKLDEGLLELRQEVLTMREANRKLQDENERLMKQHPRLVKGGAA